MKTLSQALLELERDLENVSKATFQDAGKLGVEEARHTTLFHHGASFEHQIQFQPNDSFAGKVISGAEYSQYLEYGNDQLGPSIYPKEAKALHFFSHGQEVFTKHVAAHGPLPFMDEAADKVEEKLPQLWAEEFDKRIH